MICVGEFFCLFSQKRRGIKYYAPAKRALIFAPEKTEKAEGSVNKPPQSIGGGKRIVLG
jgi:hypothetical protein